MPSSEPTPARVLIAGGGIAGMEAALALRAFAGDRVRVEMIEPAGRLTLAAESTSHPFGRVARSLPVAGLAERAGVRLHSGRLLAVDPEAHVVLTDAGEPMWYDRLVIATGARSEPAVDGALTFGGPGDVPELRRLLGRIVRGARRGIRMRLAFVVPPAGAWPLAAYELALQTARHLRRRGVRREVSLDLVTSEDAPLALFGTLSSEAVARDLAEAGIAVHTGSVVREWAWGRLILVPEGAIAADRVVALPALRGPAIAGLASDPLGFVRTGSDGRAVGAPDVFVAGDAGTFPVKQGGIACQQADAVAATIARELGAPVEPVPFDAVLRAWLWDGNGGRFMRADLPGGRDESAGVTSRRQPLWDPRAKIAGRFLSAFLRDDVGTGPLADRIAGVEAPPV